MTPTNEQWREYHYGRKPEKRKPDYYVLIDEISKSEIARHVSYAVLVSIQKTKNIKTKIKGVFNQK